MSAPNRLRDPADVQDLITALNLPQDLADRLNPSVRAKYRDLWQSAQGASCQVSHRNTQKDTKFCVVIWLETPDAG